MPNCSDAQAEVNWSHFAPSAPLHFTGHTPHSARHPQIIESRVSIQQVMLMWIVELLADTFIDLK